MEDISNILELPHLVLFVGHEGGDRGGQREVEHLPAKLVEQALALEPAAENEESRWEGSEVWEVSTRVRTTTRSVTFGIMLEPCVWIGPVSDLGLAVGEVQLLSVTRQVLRHLLQNLHPP